MVILPFGWILRAGADLKSIFQSDVLKLTQDLADKRIKDLKAKLNLLSDSLQLKSLLLKDASSIKGHGLNVVQDIFRALRGKLSSGIRTVLQQNSGNNVLQNSASMLYQSYAIAPPQITWLQKSDESNQYHTHAQNFIDGPSYQNFGSDTPIPHVIPHSIIKSHLLPTMTELIKPSASMMTSML